MTERLVYSVREAAEATGLGRSTLYEEIAAGRLVAHKRGTRTLIFARDLEAYAAALPMINVTPAARR